jgi:hypothetical protein
MVCMKTPPELPGPMSKRLLFVFRNNSYNADAVVKAETLIPSEIESQEGKSGGRGGSPELLRAEIVAIDPTIQGRGK